MSETESKVTSFEPVKRPNTPTNQVVMRMMSPIEVDTFLPKEPYMALVSAMCDPRSGALLFSLRNDGVPEDNPGLNGLQIFIATEGTKEEVVKWAADLIEFFRQQKKKAKVGYYQSHRHQMTILTTEDKK